MYEYILFDFDGTLADSSECSVIATQQAFTKTGLQEPSTADIIDNMGIPIETSFKDFGAGLLSDEEFNHLLNVFRDIYREVGDSHITAFDGAKNLLKKLKEDGKKIAIITSKKTDVAYRNAEKTGLSEFIDVIVGSDLVTEYKPHPEGIFTALKTFDVNLNKQSIIIGDAVTDISMGKNAGIDSCAVTWGAHSKAKLNNISPTHIAESFDELYNILSQDKIKCPFHK